MHFIQGISKFLKGLKTMNSSSFKKKSLKANSSLDFVLDLSYLYVL